ncbi:MAG: S-methyl-5-thioribose-1-phosphate isomerase [Planctomycetota bacterium]|jgi:methylthioribose-1-phosphate isomerase
MPVSTIEWQGDLPGWVRMIEQTRLPLEMNFVEVRTVEDMWHRIKVLDVRGAPAIGIAAAMGVVLGLQNFKGTREVFDRELDRVLDYLATSRPTAVNLFWALDRMRNLCRNLPDLEPEELLPKLLAEARLILEEDKDICRRLGANGQAMIENGQTALTHCNAGGLATGDYGTALAVFFAAKEAGKTIHVYADETRPLLQGARLTSWELMEAGIDVKLICDNMAGHVMKQGMIDIVFVGADRVAANGDAANKIGTYSVSVLAKEHGIPFFVVAPTSTFDMSLKEGALIPIEERDPREVTEGFGTRTAPADVPVYNPAFDVTPAANITGIVTEYGIIRNPSTEAVRAHFEEAGLI